jgi:GTP-binding protein
VVGRSNVGKSSLINAVTGRRALARTSQTPGKTRLCNVFAVDARYYLVDLPGYGWARASRADRAGYARLLRAYVGERRALAGIVWLLDLRHPPSPDDRAMGGLLGARRVPVLAALTKADAVPRGRRPARVRDILRELELGEDQCLVTSARTKEGIEDLRQSIDGLVGGTGGKGGAA